MTTFLIVADTNRTFSLRNVTTGRVEHGPFASRKMIREFFNLHFAWRGNFQLAE